MRDRNAFFGFCFLLRLRGGVDGCCVDELINYSIMELMNVAFQKLFLSRYEV